MLDCVLVYNVDDDDGACDLNQIVTDIPNSMWQNHQLLIIDLVFEGYCALSWTLIDSMHH